MPIFRSSLLDIILADTPELLIVSISTFHDSFVIATYYFY